MDKTELNASNFMPEDLLEIICILERGENRNLYKIIHKGNYFFLITKFPAKNGESTQLKNRASTQRTAIHQDRKEVASDYKLRYKWRKRMKSKSSRASRFASQHTNKNHKDSSNIRLVQLKPKKKSLA